VSRLKKTAIVCGYMATPLIMLHLSSFEALAADSANDWRPMFDLVMRWVNFLILAFLLIKFSRLPIKSFLASKKEDIAREIEELESAKEQILLKIDASRQQIENSKERLSKLKKTIIAQGEKNKIKLIEDAERESKILLESAKQKIESRISDAREVIKLELVDLAIALATQKLPEKITDQDNQKFIDAYLESAATK
jgi:F-type H+-transporting ATPase subunit b